jgi:polyhydroxyalkanoate synthase
MVRLVGQKVPETARAALEGLAAYERAPRPRLRKARPVAGRVGPATLHDFGGQGPPAVLVPSLINPPHVLDLDEDVSLASSVAGMDRRTLLLDWGTAGERSGLDVAGHVEHLLVPLLRELGEPPALVGYCLGGTMTVAAANLVQSERVATIAAPWSFMGYPEQSRASLLALWHAARATATNLNVLPMEVLQAAFWSLDPERTVSKFARFSELDPQEAEAQRFVVLEDWANAGEPLPLPAARELIEDFFGADLPGRGEWQVADKWMTDRLPVPLLNFTSTQDRITPAKSACGGRRVELAAGHVGMVVGSARKQLHSELARFLAER